MSSSRTLAMTDRSWRSSRKHSPVEARRRGSTGPTSRPQPSGRAVVKHSRDVLAGAVAEGENGEAAKKVGGSSPSAHTT